MEEVSHTHKTFFEEHGHIRHLNNFIIAIGEKHFRMA